MRRKPLKPGAPKAGRFISYLRVSTGKQERSGLSLEAQRAAVLAWLNGGNWTLLHEYRETESGKDDDRPELAKAIAHCRMTGAVLIVAKLDRLSRDLAFLANLMNSDVEFVCCDNPHATRFTIHILAAVAEHEREMISRRTKEALAAAKARGQKLGGFRGHIPDPAQGTAALIAHADAFARNVGPIAKQLRDEGKSLREIAAELDARGIQTRGGGNWNAAGVRRVLNRAAA